MKTTGLRIERELTVLKALKEAGFKVLDHVELPVDASEFLKQNTTVYTGLPNNFTMEVLYINNLFIACKVYNDKVDQDLNEQRTIATKKQFNLN